MMTSALKTRFHQVDAFHEHLMMTTRWYPMVVVGAWFFIIGTLAKHFL